MRRQLRGNAATDICENGVRSSCGPRWNRHLRGERTVTIHHSTADLISGRLAVEEQRDLIAAFWRHRRQQPVTVRRAGNGVTVTHAHLVGCPGREIAGLELIQSIRAAVPVDGDVLQLPALRTPLNVGFPDWTGGSGDP